MCGIAGYVGQQRVASDRLSACQQLMVPRGPDAQAVYHHAHAQGQRVYLLHSRLTIIDLHERANQPFRIGTSVLTYNGECYNYVEQRQALRARGYAFTTESDTEVLLQTLRVEGWQGMDRCEGMWAFACYDEAQGTLLLGRDRFGEKPLFLYEADEGLYFGSEVKFIVALLGRPLAVNMDHLYRYMVNGYKALYKKPHTFFEGLRALDPATVLSVDAWGGAETHRYWRPRYAPDEGMSYAEAVAGARERLVESVRLRLRADVPLAFCMSGGVDSNALICTAKKVFGYDVHGFTVVNTDARYEEQDMVDCVVQALDLRHTALPVDTSGFLEGLQTLVRHHDAPVYTITYFAHWRLMQQVAAHGYRIAVSGTAADELFTGYFDHHLAYLYEVRDDPALFAASRAAWMAHIQPIIRNPYLCNPDLFLKDPDFRDHIYLNADAFAASLHTPWQEPFTEACYTNSLLRNRMLNELFHEATPVILHEDDLNAMYFSIENRSPFLDRHLFEFCYSIPSRHLVRDGCAKAVLRDAMRGIIPEPVRTNRRKVGFNAPIFDYLDVHDPEVRAFLLDDSPVYAHVRKDHIEALLKKSQLPNSESKFLFYFLNTKIFLEAFAA